MTVTFMTGLEGQQVNATDVDGIGLGGATSSFNTNGSFVRTGAASVRCNPASGASGYLTIPTASTDWVHFALNVQTAPSLDRLIFGSIAASRLNLRLQSDSAIRAYVNTTAVSPASSALSAGWHWIGLRRNTGTSVAFLQVDGVDVGTGTGTITGDSGQIGCSAAEASAIDIYIDDVIIDDAGFLAPSKVDMALPISDNTNTACTNGAGTTTNLWDAVNNTPPTGVVSASETATTNIKYPASATENYIANLETYSTLGIVSGDTVLAVQSVVQHGEDIVTGTKNLQNVGALTNPTVGGASVVAGADAGAHGTSPSLWTTTRGTLTTSPSVTLGTSPTIQASRISEARVACIDFMGMVVAWTPGAVVANPPYVNPMPPLLAQ